jgi:hypothetical protein
MLLSLDLVENGALSSSFGHDVLSVALGLVLINV